MQAVSHKPIIEHEAVREHSPTLNTQIMIERCIRDNGSFPSRRALMRVLPNKVEYRTLVKVLQYLEASEKILLAEDGSILWVFADNPKLLKLLNQSPVLKSGDIRTSPSTARKSKRPKMPKTST